MRNPLGNAYGHGYDDQESARLNDQAGALVELLHHGTTYADGAVVLEAGCGVGAQTVTLARRSRGARFVSIDISAESLSTARERCRREGINNVDFRSTDLFARPFGPASFDHIFVCFVLEHLTSPVAALNALFEVLRPGGTITVIEGDHGSSFFHPDDAAAHDAIRCLVELQRAAGGDSMIGRRLYPLLVSTGFADIEVSPRMLYVDASRPVLIEGFTRTTFTAMVAGVRQPSIAAGLIDAARFDAGIAALEPTTGPDGVFCYTFFKAIAVKP